MNRVKVAPSLLSADPANLEKEVLSLKQAGADLLHLDVMDGHFVPSLTYGPLVADRLARLGIPLDIHLMADCLDFAVPAFLESATYLTVHAEATRHLHRVLQSIKDAGRKAGVALNPATPVDVISYIVGLADLILVMTVNPGWGGQKWIPEMAGKVRAVKEIVASSGRAIEIEVDGGVTAENAALFAEAGATILVSGSYLFKSPDRREALRALKESTF